MKYNNSIYSVFDHTIGPFRIYLSCNAFGRPGLALLIEIHRYYSCIFYAPYFEPADLWIGIYHKKMFYGDGFSRGREFYLCIIPTIVLKFRLSWPGVIHD